jgi:hypothetical protein
VVVVDDETVVVDCGCAAVASGDVAGNGGVDGLVGVSLGGAVCVTALAVQVVAVCVAKSVVSGLAWVPALKAMFQMSEK